jgi:putative protease
MDMEAFVHGAMCISYSGRCLLSNFFTGRDANRGECTHPCRWKYTVMEETRPGQYFPVEETDRGTFIFNSKDLCMIEHIPELITAGIDSLKIEGRMKTALYVATVARTYRRAIDDYLESPEKYQANMEWYKQEIGKCTYRAFTTGFYFGKPSHEDQIYDSNTYIAGAVYMGTIRDTDADGWSYLEQKNKFSVGETLEIMRPDGTDTEAKVLEIRDAETDIPQESCPHACQKLKVRLSAMPEKGEILRRLE